ncbi:MAG: DNA primase [Pseudomonadota bacterium]
MAMRLPDGFLDELKARARPSQVIGKKVKLQRRGKEWVGLSPFTNEKTPSFYVNDAKQMFKCFSSGLGGDVIKFVMETERLGFMEAVERVAGEVGMAIPTASPEVRERYSRLDRLKSVCKAAQDFFVGRLKSADGADARRYLDTKRGLGPDAWGRHGIGYAPNDWRQLLAHLKALDFKTDEIVAAGLAKVSDKGGEPYDVFRNRVMFPITDIHGDVIAFGGRALDPEDKAKYLNSPETELFHKSSVLYNYKRAREAIGYGERGGLLVCEGYMDVIALAEAGFGNAVAPLGTALTPQQLSMVWKAGPDPILCFDGDGAGTRAAFRAIDVALPHLQPDKSVFICLLPDKMDPDDLLKTEGGQERMAALLNEPLALVEMLWRRERDAEPLDTPERKAGLGARLKAAAGAIQNPDVRAAYQQDLAQRMRDHFFRLRGPQSMARRIGGVNAGSGQNGGRGPGPDVCARKATHGMVKGLGYLVRAVDNPALLDNHGETLAAAAFPDPDVRCIQDAIFAVYTRSGEVDRAAVRTHLLGCGKARAVNLLDQYPRTPEFMSDGPEAREWLIALEQFVSADELDAAEGIGSREAATQSADNLKRFHRQIAEGHAWRARLNEAAQKAGR